MSNAFYRAASDLYAICVACHIAGDRRLTYDMLVTMLIRGTSNNFVRACTSAHYLKLTGSRAYLPITLDLFTEHDLTYFDITSETALKILEIAEKHPKVAHDFPDDFVEFLGMSLLGKARVTSAAESKKEAPVQIEVDTDNDCMDCDDTKCPLHPSHDH